MLWLQWYNDIAYVSCTIYRIYKADSSLQYDALLEKDDAPLTTNDAHTVTILKSL